MSKEVEKVEKQTDVIANPFASRQSDTLSHGAVAIESSRAVAQVQAQALIAKAYPRDTAKAWSRIMTECRRESFANSALYSFPRAGSRVEGASIRLAEMLARNWENIEFGIRELARNGAESEMEAYAIDLEMNTASRQGFTVRHIRDTRDGGKKLDTERDVYEMTANMGARRLRSRILALIPGDVTEAAINQCKKTIRDGGGQPLADRVRAMVDEFSKLGVSPKRIEQKLGYPISECTPDDLVELTATFKAIRDGVSSVSEAFPMEGAGKKSATDSLRGMVSGEPATKDKEPDAK